MTARAHPDDDDMTQDFPSTNTAEARAAGELGLCTERRVGDEHLYMWPSVGYGIGFTRLRQKSDGTYGMMTIVDDEVHVTTGKPNTYYWGSFNLEANKSRHDLALQLAKTTDMANTKAWETMLGTACQRAYNANREGKPEVDVATHVPQPVQWAIKNLLLKGESNVLFGPGGGLKSFVMDAVAVAVACGHRVGDFEPEVEGAVLLADYETTEDEIASRCQRIARAAGLTIPKDGILYRQYWQNFAEEAHVTRALVDRYKCVFVGVDSIAYAVDGQVVPQMVMPFFNTLRSLGPAVTKVVISHITKAAAADPDAPATEFGSAFVRNSARASWEVTRGEADMRGNIPLALYNRKINQGKFQPTVYLTVAFDGDYGPVHFTGARREDAPELLSKAATIERLRVALQHGPMTAKEIALNTGLKEAQVAGELIRQTNRHVIPIRQNGREEWALLDHGHETPPRPDEPESPDADEPDTGRWVEEDELPF